MAYAKQARYGVFKDELADVGKINSNSYWEYISFRLVRFCWIGCSVSLL